MGFDPGINGLTLEWNEKAKESVRLAQNTKYTWESRLNQEAETYRVSVRNLVDLRQKHRGFPSKSSSKNTSLTSSGTGRKQKKEKKRTKPLYSVCTIWKANKARTHSFFIVLFYDDKYVFIHFYVQNIVRNKNKLAFNDIQRVHYDQNHPHWRNWMNEC